MPRFSRGEEPSTERARNCTLLLGPLRASCERFTKFAEILDLLVVHNSGPNVDQQASTRMAQSGESLRQCARNVRHDARRLQISDCSFRECRSVVKGRIGAPSASARSNTTRSPEGKLPRKLIACVTNFLQPGSPSSRLHLRPGRVSITIATLQVLGGNGSNAGIPKRGDNRQQKQDLRQKRPRLAKLAPARWKLQRERSPRNAVWKRASARRAAGASKATRLFRRQLRKDPPPGGSSARPVRASTRLLWRPRKTNSSKGRLVTARA